MPKYSTLKSSDSSSVYFDEFERKGKEYFVFIRYAVISFFMKMEWLQSGYGARERRCEWEMQHLFFLC